MRTSHLWIPNPGSPLVFESDISNLGRRAGDLAGEFAKHPATGRDLFGFNVPNVIALGLCLLAVFVKARDKPR